MDIRGLAKVCLLPSEILPIYSFKKKLKRKKKAYGLLGMRGLNQ
jgi:hypothetical protein